MESKKITKREIVQFIKFGFVGLSNTFISYITYVILVKLGVYYLLASVIGFVVSVANSFFWNYKFVFKPEAGEHRSIFYSFIKTLLSYSGTGLLLSNILLFMQVEMLGIPEYIAPLVNLVITVPLNFLLNKFWAFKGK